jgi:hypothetical protein
MLFHVKRQPDPLATGRRGSRPIDSRPLGSHALDAVRFRRRAPRGSPRTARPEGPLMARYYTPRAMALSGSRGASRTLPHSPSTEPVTRRGFGTRHSACRGRDQWARCLRSEFFLPAGAPRRHRRDLNAHRLGARTNRRAWNVPRQLRPSNVSRETPNAQRSTCPPLLQPTQRNQYEFDHWASRANPPVLGPAGLPRTLNPRTQRRASTRQSQHLRMATSFPTTSRASTTPERATRHTPLPPGSSHLHRRAIPADSGTHEPAPRA